jgi:PAS domain S-box-containing protein
MAEQAESRAFRSGVAQVITCRQRQEDGLFALAPFRAEPGYAVSVPAWPMVQGPDEPWTIADAVGETADAIAAAKIAEQLHGTAFAFDASGKFTYATPAAQTCIGLKLEDLNRSLGGGNFIDGGDLGWKLSVHPDDYEATAATLRDCMRTGEHYNHEYRLRRATGEYVWHRVAIRPTINGQGRITGWYGTGQDIDAQKNTEAALRANEQRLQRIIDTVPALIWSLSPDGTPLYVNRRVTETTGISFEDLMLPGQRLLTIVHPDQRQAVAQSLSLSVETGTPFKMNYRQVRADGSYRWTESRAEPLRDDADAILGWFGVAVDIHDMVTAQEALRERERELTHLIDMVPSFIWRLNPDGQPNFYNKRLVDYLGLDPTSSDPAFSNLAAVMGTAVHPDDAIALRDALVRSFNTGETFSMKCRLRRADGVYRWTDGSAEPLRDVQGHIIQWYGLSNDIEDQMNAAAALQDSELQFQLLVETMPAMVYCADPDGSPRYRSRQLREFLGLAPDDTNQLLHILGGPVHPDDQPTVQEKQLQSLSSGEPYRMKHRLRRFDGTYRWVETRAAPMRNSEGDIVQWNGVCIDIDGEVQAQDELRLAQESLAQASQAASLAELSASIAHEVNQPLAAIVANSHAAERWLAADPPNIKRAENAVMRVTRDANAAAEIVSHIRALFKQTTETRESTEFSKVITQARDLVAEEAGRRGVRILLPVEVSLPPVMIDRVQIQQVLVNLMRNGMEAMDEVKSDRVLRVQVQEAGDSLQTEILDAGPGIAFPDQMFEPFFSTKQQGMGMGLAICRSIVEAHGGRLWAENVSPQGARLAFTLPILKIAA